MATAIRGWLARLALYHDKNRLRIRFKTCQSGELRSPIVIMHTLATKCTNT